MTRLFNLRALCLLLAVLAYSVNGARAHIMVTGGEKLTVALCGNGDGGTISIDLPNQGPQQVDYPFCDVCALPGIAVLPDANFVSAPLETERHAPAVLRSTAPERHPVWPGAPPVGPPAIGLI